MIDLGTTNIWLYWLVDLAIRVMLTILITYIFWGLVFMMEDRRVILYEIQLFLKKLFKIKED